LSQRQIVVAARYVEVNYVRAKVVGSGICVQNGIIHQVDHILGIPGRSVYQEIAHNPSLRQDALTHTPVLGLGEQSRA